VLGVLANEKAALAVITPRFHVEGGRIGDCGGEFRGGGAGINWGRRRERGTPRRHGREEETEMGRKDAKAQRERREKGVLGEAPTRSLLSPLRLCVFAAHPPKTSGPGRRMETTRNRVGAVADKGA